MTTSSSSSQCSQTFSDRIKILRIIQIFEFFASDPPKDSEHRRRTVNLPSACLGLASGGTVIATHWATDSHWWNNGGIIWIILNNSSGCKCNEIRMISGWNVDTVILNNWEHETSLESCFFPRRNLHWGIRPCHKCSSRSIMKSSKDQGLQDFCDIWDAEIGRQFDDVRCSNSYTRNHQNSPQGHHVVGWLTIA